MVDGPSRTMLLELLESLKANNRNELTRRMVHVNGGGGGGGEDDEDGGGGSSSSSSSSGGNIGGMHGMNRLQHQHGVELMRQLIVYSPLERIGAEEALVTSPFFNATNVSKE
jgi:hypothetical protein